MTIAAPHTYVFSGVCFGGRVPLNPQYRPEEPEREIPQINARDSLVAYVLDLQTTSDDINTNISQAVQ